MATQVPGFRLLVAGDGPDRPIAEAAARQHPWLTYLGRVEGVEERAKLLAAADALLVPGLVGLVVLDGFAAGVPLVTAAYSYHSPEIEYLEPEVNGVAVREAESVEAYAAAVVRVLRDRVLRERLRAGCLESAGRYTVEAMVGRFATGVTRALAA